MRTVERLLEAKGYDIWSITPDAAVYEAVKLMADKAVGALLVLESGKLVGIISERDCTRRLILKERAPKDTLVREIMTSDVITVRPGQTVEECMALVTAKRIRHLPVLAGDQLIGIISIGDLVKDIISEQEFMIQQLEGYIKGG
ncbi:MAG: CBS domain-containing protein [Anaerolineae bacterium]